MNMKKFSVILWSVLLVFAFAACGGEEEKEPAS